MTQKEFFNAVLAIENVPVEVKEYAEMGLIKLKERKKDNRMVAAAEIGKTLEDILPQMQYNVNIINEGRFAPGRNCEQIVNN